MSCTEKKVPVNQCSLSVANGSRTSLSSDAMLILDSGDPMIFESFWKKMDDKCTIEIPSGEYMSYYSNSENVSRFLEPELEEAIRRLHGVVGNAATRERYIVVGTGSTQVFQAALYAITSPGGPEPISVVSSAPYYSSYPEVTDILRSALYKWGGDACTFDKDGPYIEVVNLPNNPDGSFREAEVNREGGRLIYDLAYYWPHYTAISHQADYDIMLFTFSKCTGHAGSRIGWALVKDKDIATKMCKFIEISSFGISKESQLRAAKIMRAICDGCSNFELAESEDFFKYGRRLMTERWEKLINFVKNVDFFSLPKYPQARCLFTGEFIESVPAFAWLKCKEGIEDGESFLRRLKIIGRGGRRFGCDPKYVRVSLLSRDEEFNNFLERLSYIKGIGDGH